MKSALGFNGKVEENGVFKVEFSRQDGPFEETGFNRNPEYFADGYLAFYMPGTFSGTSGAAAGSAGTTGTTGAAGASGSTAGALDNVFVAGEIPLRENEVANFEQALERANIWIPAVHNHEIQEMPRLIFVHVETVGSAHQIASAIRQAMNQTKGHFKEDQARQVSTPGVSGLANIPSTIGYNGRLEEENGVLTVIVPRQEQLTDCAIAITQQNNGTNGTAGAGAGASGSSSSTGTAGSGMSTTGASGSGSSSTGTTSTGTSGSGTATTGTGSTDTGASGTGSANSGASAVGMSSDAGMASNNCLLANLQAQPGMNTGTSTGTTGSAGTGTSNTGASGSGSTSTGTTGTGTNGTAGAGSTTGTTSSNMSLIPPQVGAVSEFRFEMGGNGSVDVDAEFALLATEAPQTVRLLRENGFVVGALHNHFAFESPRLLFLHASGQGSASKLAQVIRMALDQNAALSGTGTGAAGSGSTGTGTTGSGTSGSTGSSSGSSSSGSTSSSSGPAL